MSFYGKDGAADEPRPTRTFRVHGPAGTTTVQAHDVWFMDGGYVAFVNNPEEPGEFIVCAVAPSVALTIEEVKA